MGDSMLFRLIIVFYIISLSLAFSHGTKKKSIKAHEHGVGILNIAQEGNVLLFEFELPGYDVVGFEYKAKEDKDLKKVENAISTLLDYKNMIKPSGKAGCNKIDSRAEVLYEGTHSEFIGKYVFSCQNLSELKIVYINYFNKFELSKKLNIKILGNNKKSAYVISKPKRILNVKGHF